MNPRSPRPAPPKPAAAAPERPPRIKHAARNEARSLQMRTCIVTREERHQSALLRIFEGPDGSAYAEATSKHKDEGRGAWVTPTAAAIGVLVADSKRLARALKVPYIDSSQLLERARALTAARIVDFLSLSSRSGRLASGADAATSAVRAGEARALLVASDASASSIADIRGAREIPVYVLPFEKEELGRRIGKGARAVIALRSGGPAKDLLIWLERGEALAQRTASPPVPPE